MDWGDLKSKIRNERDRLRKDPKAAWSRSKLLEAAASEYFQTTRRGGETDEELWARISDHPDFDRVFDHIRHLRLRGDTSELDREDSFMDELLKL